MDKYETEVLYNIAETCCASISISDLEVMTGDRFPVEKLLNRKLTYGSIPGSRDTRSVVAQLVNTPTGPIEVSGDDVLLTNGAIGANFLVYYALCGPGDHVIVVDPAYQQLNSVPKMFGATVHLLKLRPENGFQPDLEELEQLVLDFKPKLININSPHNPSGTHLSDPTLEKIVGLAKINDSYLLCDEVYRPLFHSADEQPKSVATLYERGIITGSTSKAFSMAGLRTGWVVSSNKEVIAECLKRRDYNIISVSYLDDLTTGWLLRHRAAILDRNYKLCRENLKIIKEFKERVRGKISYVEPTGGSTMLIELPNIQNTAEFCRQLAVNKKTMLVPGENFNLPGTVRLGFGNPTEELVKGLSHFEDLLKEYKE